MSAELVAVVLGFVMVAGGALAAGLFAWVGVTGDAHGTLAPLRRRALIAAVTAAVSLALVGVALVIGAAGVALLRSLGAGH